MSKLAIVIRTRPITTDALRNQVLDLFDASPCSMQMQGKETSLESSDMISWIYNMKRVGAT
jgi:hypothetical protein